MSEDIKRYRKLIEAATRSGDEFSSLQLNESMSLSSILGKLRSMFKPPEKEFKKPEKEEEHPVAHDPVEALLKNNPNVISYETARQVLREQWDEDYNMNTDFYCRPAEWPRFKGNALKAGYKHITRGTKEIFYAKIAIHKGMRCPVYAESGIPSGNYLGSFVLVLDTDREVNPRCIIEGKGQVIYNLDTADRLDGVYFEAVYKSTLYGREMR